MKMLKLNQRGFSHLEILAVIVLVGVLVGTFFYVSSRQGKPTEHKVETSFNTSKTDTKDVVWQFNEQTQKWQSSSTPPQCDKQVFKYSPVDTSQATSVLYPGQYRGMNYKAHGGFAFDNSKNGTVQVVMPMDAQLTNASRYIETGEVQYILDFINPCGISFRFDHLYELSSAFQKIADTLPEPKVDDTRGTFINPPVNFKAGEVVATAVGHPSTQNFGMDFGVYDLRKPNEMSKNQTWANIHKAYSAQHWFGVCWFDMLPAADAARVKALPSRDFKSGKRSDYCANSAGTTLQVNNGLPV